MKIHKILLLLPVLALAACADYDHYTEQTLSGDGTKTPLTVTALLNTKGKAAKTRAKDNEFDNGDQMIAYIRHVEWNGGFTTEEANKRTSKIADQAPRLINLSCTGYKAWSKTMNIMPFGSELEINSTNTQQASGLSVTYKNTKNQDVNGLYWDDFSDATSSKTDLHSANNYLQSYYGYCYNGGEPTTALIEETGVIGWTVQKDQSGTTGTTNFQKSDLLWSPEQKPVKYAHADKNVDGDHGDLIIPYTHAMSKVTINVIAGEGFAADYDFKTGEEDTKVELKDVRIKCTAKAPTAELEYSKDAGSKGNIKMKPGNVTKTNEKPSRAYEAIVVPSILSVGNTLATITDMAGNTYDILVTEAMLEAKSDGTGWGHQLDNDVEDVDNGTAQARPRTRATGGPIPTGQGHQMRSGVHYKLNVTVSKTKVTVYATILDWEEVEAESVGEIIFENDVKDNNGTIVDALQHDGFDVYMSAFDSNNSTPNYGPLATHLKYNSTTHEWSYNPTIYWQGIGKQYFRALSGAKDDKTATPENESLIMENGRDALWGTTAEANGYTEGQAVSPRTGHVPLKFYHAMSQITFNLVDALAGNSDGSSHLDLHGATIQLTNLATGGTIELFEGKITPSAVTEKTFSEDAGAIPSRMGFFASKENDITTTYKEEVTLRNYIITPQTIKNEAMVIITLADGTVYKAQLNKCITEVTANGQTGDEYITEWKPGVHYTYTIELGKETITFRAVVEEWKKVEGGGKATLEWD
ncbi:MAG: fimbrillin family protein [Bacteroidaceae bacterium]|nr:fimbrillin family protein [Bacteroidaceae bacterium]